MAKRNNGNTFVLVIFLACLVWLFTLPQVAMVFKTLLYGDPQGNGHGVSRNF